MPNADQKTTTHAQHMKAYTHYMLLKSTPCSKAGLGLWCSVNNLKVQEAAGHIISIHSTQPSLAAALVACHGCCEFAGLSTQAPQVAELSTSSQHSTCLTPMQGPLIL
jgi:hypothetical protein